MGFPCKLLGHRWKNGICQKCGEVHEKHRWERIPLKCLMSCTVCGKTEAVEHKWIPVEGKCREIAPCV